MTRHRGIFERPKGSGVWYIRFKDESGRLHKEKVGPKGLAQKVYQKRRTQIAERRFFPETLKPWDPLFSDYIDDYVARRRSTVRDPSGAGRYARYWKEAPETQDKSMRQLTVEDFERYRERRRQGGAIGAQRARGGASPSTTNKELSFARAVFNDFVASLEARGLPPIANPVRNRKDRRLFADEAPTRTRWLGQSGDDEEARLRAELSDADWPKVLVAMHTGLDRGAQFSLRWSQVDLQTRTIQAERRKGRREGAVPVVIPINDELLAVLRALPSRLVSDYVFPNASNTSSSDGREFDRLIFRPALRRAGIKDFRWKDLRHTFATRLRMTGSDTATIRDLLGHTTDRMTKRYAHAAPGLLHAAVQRLVRAAPAPPAAHAGDPVGDPDVRTAKPARAGERPTARRAERNVSVPDRIRTGVTGVKGRCPGPD